MYFKLCAANKRTRYFRFHTDAQQSIYILQNFCIIDSMKLYNQGFPFLYNTFYQGSPKILPGGEGVANPAPALATPLTR